MTKEIKPIIIGVGPDPNIAEKLAELRLQEKDLDVIIVGPDNVPEIPRILEKSIELIAPAIEPTLPLTRRERRKQERKRKKQ